MSLIFFSRLSINITFYPTSLFIYLNWLVFTRVLCDLLDIPNYYSIFQSKIQALHWPYLDCPNVYLGFNKELRVRGLMTWPRLARTKKISWGRYATTYSSSRLIWLWWGTRGTPTVGHSSWLPHPIRGPTLTQLTPPGNWRGLGDPPWKLSKPSRLRQEEGLWSRYRTSSCLL